MRHQLLIALLLLLAACSTPSTSNVTQYTDNQPLPREEPTYQAQPEEGLERWRTYDKNAATFLVNDGEVSVRAFLEEEQEITLDLREQTTIKIGIVGEEQAQFIINNQTTTLQEGETTTREVVNIQLTETITKN